MHIEYEARALDVNKDDIEKKLVKIGAQKVADFDYKRKVYDFNPKTNNKWIRLRTDGTTTTLTIKEYVNNSIDGTREMEIKVSNFDETDKILNELGYVAHTYQESKRTRYVLNGVELDIDTWPYIPTYLEIEGKDENDVLKTADALGIDKSKITTLDVQSVFKEFYKINIKEMPILKFGEELDDKYKIDGGKKDV